MTTQNPAAPEVMAPQPRKLAASGLREELHEGLSGARETAKNFYERGKERAQVWERAMEDRIRDKPIQSVLIAAGVGAGVGLLLGIVLARR